MSNNERDSKSLGEAVKFLSDDYKLEDAYIALGMQLDAVEAIEEPIHLATWMQESVDIKKTANDFIQKASDFIKAYWQNIVKNACAWWKDNKDKIGDKLVAGLTPIIAAIIPLPWGAIGGIVALIATILIKAGMDTICIGKLPKMPI